MVSDLNSSLNKLPQGIILEACVETIDDAVRARKNGAQQIEWCGDLSEDGLTPDRSLTLSLLKVMDIPVKVIIRCRPGDFIYRADEMQKMVKDADYFSSLPGISGLVFGAVHDNRTLNTSQIEYIIDHSNGLPLTLHKAIDTCGDILSEVKRAADIRGLEFILSSGGSSTALEGIGMLQKMQQCFRGKIIAAGKINRQNLATLHGLLSFQYYHGKQIVNI